MACCTAFSTAFAPCAGALSTTPSSSTRAYFPLCHRHASGVASLGKKLTPHRLHVRTRTERTWAFTLLWWSCPRKLWPRCLSSACACCRSASRRCCAARCCCCLCASQNCCFPNRWANRALQGHLQSARRNGGTKSRLAATSLAWSQAWSSPLRGSAPLSSTASWPSAARIFAVIVGKCSVHIASQNSSRHVSIWPIASRQLQHAAEKRLNSTGPALARHRGTRSSGRAAQSEAHTPAGILLKPS
mmetsp:Transcript_27054/g.81608  ORF Transcript_27054/g.81608 Transcript_27054/m.81608 type:complete len:245 (-) Transcript_27054:283-1017(-)